MIIRQLRTRSEWKQYYDLRYRILREPWDQPKGSEKDELEEKSFHIACFLKGKIIGVGRLHFNSPDECQVRFMAVDKGHRKKGAGSRILESLEETARQRKAKSILLNARENALGFYKKHGYRIVGKGDALFGEIPHFEMRKEIQ